MTTTAPVLDAGDRPDPAAPRPPRRPRAWLVGAVVIVAAALVATTLTGGDGAQQDDAPPPAEEVAPVTSAVVTARTAVVVDGLVDGAVLDAAAIADLVVTVTTEGAPVAELVALLDGEPLAVQVGDRLTVDTTTLEAVADGEHTLTLTPTGTDGATGEPTSIGFTVDRTAPTVTLPAPIEAAARDAELVVEVTVDEEATLAADGAVVTWVDATTATLRFPSPPPSVVVTATDGAGNTSTVDAPVVVPFPGGRAVHTTPSAWRYEPKRTPIIDLLETGQIDAVQLDIKDELGDVSWDTGVELAGLTGAEDFNRSFDIRAAIETIHSYDARVIGRLVVYRDTRLAQWAWNNGRPDMVLQATDGTPYAGRYGDYAFTNFANPDVQQYNIDIALEAADVGFDDVLYDYIRRPDGAIEKLVVPGLGDRTPEEAVVEVMATAYPLLRERGVWVGASVFGIAVDRPTQMAQHIPSMAPHVDYIAPMVYPNHWNLGEYDVPVPEEAPYDIVERSLTLYREALEGTGVALVPWLQDFGGYGEAEVRAQIDATEAVTGERSFLLWSSGATYTHEALDPIPGRGPAASPADDAEPAAEPTDG